MFLAHIAFALNLIALAVGAFLVGWGVYKAEKCATAYGNVNQNIPEGSRHCHSKGHCATTFAKVFGIIVMILAIIGLICTVVCAVKYKQFWHEKREMLEQNYHANSNMDSDQSTSTTTSTNPGNASD